MPRKRKDTKPPRIEDFIDPLWVAESVIVEVDCRVPLDMTRAELRALADKLADRATKIYACDENFRRRLRGNVGRDLLFAFMRHWLAADLKGARPNAFAQLPESFRSGEPLTGPERTRSPAEIEAASVEARETERDVADDLLRLLMESIDAALKRSERPCLDLAVRSLLGTIHTALKHPDADLERVVGPAENAVTARTRPRKSHLRVI